MMKRLLTSFSVAFFVTMNLFAQTTTKVVQIKGADNGCPLTHALVSTNGTKNMTFRVNRQGRVNFLKMLPDGKYTLTISADGYEATQREIVVARENKKSELLEVILEPYRSSFCNVDETFDEVYEGQDDFAPITQSSLLNSSRNPFVSAASYVFSTARFNRRGYDSPYRAQFLNGVPMNDLNTGYGVWSLWGGLNDVTRNQDNGSSFEPLEGGFGSIGMSNNLTIRASKVRAETKLTFSTSNRTYTERMMATYATGQMDNGWSVAVSLSKRNGDGLRSYVRGQHYDAYGYLLALEKRFNDYSSLGLVAFGAPTRRGVASGSTQEAYDLVNSNFYNPNVGMQGGKWRNAREKNMHEPVIQLTHYLTLPNQTFKMNTTVGYRFGFNTYSALNWYNAPDPRPDYYRNLPSYYTDLANLGQKDEETANLYANLWHSERNIRYVDWDKLYQINQRNSDNLYNSKGELLARGHKALYMIDLRHTDQKEFSMANNFTWHPLDWLSLDGGVNYRYNVTNYFNEVGDLLGATYVYDIDKFAERDFGANSDMYQMDLNNPDHIAVKGDRFGNDYYAVTQKGQTWANLKFKFSHIDAYLGGSVTQTNVYREGNQKRGLFPDNSYGRSNELGFLDFGVKTGLTYKINGRHYVVANAAYVEQAPNFRNIFISPRTRNTYINGIKSEKLFSADLTYAIRMPRLRGNVTMYYTQILDKSKAMSFYDDAAAAFSNYTLTGIATRHYGAEVGLEASLTPTLSLNFAGALGQYKYSDDAHYKQTVDNSSRIIDEDEVHWKGLNTSGGPQTVASIGMTYRAPWYGMLGFNANYFGRSFISMNPSLRTDRARMDFGHNTDYILPEKLKGGFTVDLFVGYSYRISHGKYIRFNLSVNNILNNKNLNSGGYEQLRVRTTRQEDGSSKLYKPFPSKYFYAYGTTYFFNTSIQF